MRARFVETLCDTYGQEFEIDEVYFEQKTEHQHLIIFHNAVFGRMMVLDGVVQTTERDEFIYHEMLTHVPILAHGEVDNLLVIGGGDGAILREISRHRSIQRITQVEIDATVIEQCRKYLPNHSAGAFDDPRLHTVIADGLDFLSREGERYDVIICDSTDPVGPGKTLFTAEFYATVQRRLQAGGIFVAQNGVPFHQMDELCDSHRQLRERFIDHGFYGAAVPSYIGGIMAFAWASDSAARCCPDEATLNARYVDAGLACRYYNPAIHRAAFALPEYLLEALRQA